MIYNEETYCTVQHKIVRELGACEAVVYGTIAGLLRKTDGYGGVSNQTIMDMCGMNRKSLSRYIDKLIQAGYIEKVSGDGRGNISIYYISKKGDKLTTFNEEKGGQNDPKRGTNLPIKGDKMTPINKGINKEYKEREETPTPYVMEKEFLEFWDLYPDSSDFDYDKQHCYDVWCRISQEWQEKLLQQLRMGLRWRNKPNDRPFYYLLDYRGQDVQVELPIMRQGTTKFAKWIEKAQSENAQVCLMWEKDGDDKHIVYCLESDRKICEAAGLEFCRNM